MVRNYLTSSIRNLLRKSYPVKLWHVIFPILILISLGIMYWRFEKRKQVIAKAKLPEELVFVRSDDDIVNGGVMFSPGKNAVKPAAIVWIHGWGVNFYSPTYITIGRAAAARGFTCIVGNTRMHDIGNVEGHKWGKRIRGGGYWGVASDEVHDLAAWIDFAESQGFKQVILVGHSAGWAAVRRYQAEKQDKRVIGLVSASGSIYPDTRQVDSAQLVQALRMMADGEGEDLIKDPKRSFPSFISAATFMDIVNTPPEYKDFFGFNSPNSGITKIECPVLAFFGTDGDVGDEAELESLKAGIKKQPHLKSKVITALIHNADHMYAGEEEQVSETITKWADDILKQQ